jgi:hypothetical protein
VPASILGRAVIPDEVPIDVVRLADLPRNWSAPDSPPKLRDIGQRWLEQRHSAVLKVPSAVVVEEWNYLLNPQHADFKKLALGRPKRSGGPISDGGCEDLTGIKRSLATLGAH